MSKNSPLVIFIIPYRNRQAQRTIFENEMKKYLDHIELQNYEIFFVCQEDSRQFNRGAMKNLGFLYVKYKYPADYKNITIVFNDVDTIPTKESNIRFEITEGTIAHYYGTTFALGGIFAIKAGDFEKTTGFPNFWYWGFEDNQFNNRVLKAGFTIDRTIFYDIKTNKIEKFKHITRLDETDSPIKLLSSYENECFFNKTIMGGFKEIQKVDTYVNGSNIIIKYFECEFDYTNSVSYEFKKSFLLTNVVKQNDFFKMFYI